MSGYSCVLWGRRRDLSIRVAAVDHFLLARDRDFLAHLADCEADREVGALSDGKRDRFPFERLETSGSELDIVDAGFEERDGVEPRHCWSWFRWSN